MPSDDTDEYQRLRVAIGLVSRRMRLAYATGETDDGITFMELAVLHRLQRVGSVTNTELARGERVTAQSLVPVLASLVRRDLVERVPDPKDRRKIQIAITQEGLHVIASRNERSSALLAQAIDKALTPAERSSVLKVAPLLERIAERL